MLWETEYQHVTAFGLVNRQEGLTGHRGSEAVSPAVHQNKVAHFQRRHHGLGRDLVGLVEKASERKDHEQHGEKARSVIDPPGFWIIRSATFRGHQLVKKPQHTGDHHGHQQDQRKIDVFQLIIHFQYRKEGILWNFHATHLLHSLLTGFLFFQQLLFT